MTFKQERFENFPNSTTFNSTNAGLFAEAAFTSIGSNGNTFFTTTADAGHGGSCLEVTGLSGTAGQFDLVDTASAQGVLAFDFKLLAFPTVNGVQFPVVWRGASAIGRLEMNTSGQLRCSMVGTGTYGTALALNTWYRIEIILTGLGTASSAVTLNVYVGDNTGTPYATDTVSGQTTAIQMDRFRFYRTSTEATALSCRYDTIRQDIGSSTPLGPPPVPAGVNQIGYRSLWSPAAASQASLR